MEKNMNIELSLKLNELIMLWRNFCESHTQLYELTCDEYMHLLASDIDELNVTVQNKLQVLDVINQLEKERQSLTNEIMECLGQPENKKLTLLLGALRQANYSDVAIQIERLNALLIDIIEKVQEQNKKNQVFLNKAIISLQELRESFAGKTNFKTYSAAGTTRSNNTL